MDFPKKMNAIGFFENLSIDNEQSFIDAVLPTPEPQENDLLVEVKGISINPVDTKIRETLGVTPTLPPIAGYDPFHDSKDIKVIGYDAIGIVRAKGMEVTKFNIGDRVYYSGTTKRPGSHEQFQLVDENLAAVAPDSLTDAEAASLPLTSLAAYELLFEKLGVSADQDANKGKKILIINGAGGVGSILTQLASWAGLEVFATGGSESVNWLEKLGADHAIDYHHDLKDELIKAGTDRVDYIAVLYDIAPYFKQLVQLIKPFGHIGTIVGTKSELPMTLLKNLSVSFDWEYMFAKSDYSFNMASQGEILSRIATLIDSKKIFPTVSKSYDSGINATNIKAATKDVLSGHMQGKVVITGPFNGN
ncbi:zinc-binding alcohol dehydrogenase family protein [Furfurilactobacillus sp. WILCCON 0119]